MTILEKHIEVLTELKRFLCGYNYLLSLHYQYIFDTELITDHELNKANIFLYLLQMWSEQSDLRIVADLYMRQKSYSEYTDYQKAWLQNMVLNELFLLTCSENFYRVYNTTPLATRVFRLKDLMILNLCSLFEECVLS